MGRDWLAERRRATPERAALALGRQRWTYGELDDLVSGLCRRLINLGLHPDQRAAALLPSSLLYVCLVHALARLGVVLVPLNSRLTPIEIAWQVEAAGCQWLFYDQTMAGIVEKLPALAGQATLINEETLSPASAPFAPEDSPFVLDRAQAILFTSGTSGRPKGAVITFANHFYSAMASAYHLGAQPDDRWLCCLPLYHVGGLAILFRCCLYGAAVILQRRFELDPINQSLDEDQPTLISLVPTMLQRLLAARDHWPASLRLILLGGAASDPALIRQANALPRRPASGDSPPPLVAPTYGLTEAASQVATMLPAEAVHKPGSVGRPLLFTSVNIVDERGDELPAGQIGEIVVAGPTVMAGYWGQPAAGGVIQTGDMGYLDNDGDLWVVQRRADLIVSGGENVYPAEVEAALKAHPAIENACVVGLPHPEWGQEVTAMLVAGSQATEVELIDFVRRRLAGYKIPRRLYFVDALPLTASGKIARQAVREQLESLSHRS